MEQIIINQYLILLDGEPMSLITQSGLNQWQAAGLEFSFRFDEVTVKGEHFGKYRCIYEKVGSPEQFLLVEPPSAPNGFKVVLFDRPPRVIH